MHIKAEFDYSYMDSRISKLLLKKEADLSDFLIYYN